MPFASGDTDDEFSFNFWTASSNTLELNGGFPNYASFNTYSWVVDEWYMLALTYNGTNAYRRSINGGTLSGPSFNGTIPNPLTGTITKVHMGKGIVGNYFNGAIDDVRIYDKVLSIAEIQALYNSALQ